MSNRRNSIQMNTEEMWHFITSQKSMHVCNLNNDGTPHLVTMWFTIDDGNIILVSYSKSQKILNLKRNPSIALLCEDGQDYKELRGASINSDAELVNDPDKVKRYETALILRNQKELTDTQAEELAARMCSKKTVIVVRPVETKTWDHSKLDVEY
ncbi:MAG: hypothetical protein GKR93_09790 [Gammaproteobacteria bacterium]|nr:hypothetical protein [Gammaproteobacteria bacterium]